jgi:beta-glucanase (GH16 family)
MDARAISILVDGKSYFTFKKEAGYQWQQWPFDKPFHLILNVAVGGDWGGQKGVDDSIFPQKMEVDYVRVYPLVRKSNFEIPVHGSILHHGSFRCFGQEVSSRHL